MVDRATPRRERFDTLFAADPDPWNFETSSYERSKRAQTIAALGCRRFRIALEIGCATGVLTKELAKVCDRIIGIDVSDCALSIAQERLRDISNIELRQGEIPNEWPAGLFNLVVFSEVLYFLSEQEIRDASARARQSMTGNGVCLLVNWTGPTDLPLDGHEVVELFTEAGHWNCIGAMQAPNFRIEKFELL